MDNLTLPVILFASGCILWAIALVNLIRTVQFISRGIQTQATVVRIDRYVDEGQNMYAPVFEYLDQSHTRRIFKSPGYSSKCHYTEGEQLKILYDPHKSGKARVYSFWGIYRPILIPMAFAVVLTIPYVFRQVG